MKTKNCCFSIAIAIILLLIIMSVDTLFAQDTISVEQLPEFKESLFVHLDTTKITTRILRDKHLFPSVDLSKYTGDTLSDTITLAQWRQAYFEIYNGCLDSTKISKIAVIDSLARTYIEQNIIPIAILSTDYNQIDSTAFETGLLKIENSKIYDISAKGETPYLEKQVFAAAALKTTNYGLDVTFVIDGRFLIGIPGSRYQWIKVNFGDGLGYREVTPGSTVIVHYSSYGKKAIFIKAKTLGITGRTYFSYFSLWVLEPAAKIDFQIPGTSYTAYGLYGSGNTTIRKPIIIVEGFDPGNENNYEEIYWRICQQNLASRMRAMGYDIIIMNFKNGADYIQNNAMALVDLINYVNANKTSAEDLVIVGASMGGLVARWALMYMENNNIEHHIRLFVSFDSPQQGANVPLGDQYLVRFDADIVENEGAITNKQLLCTPAACQMLYNHFISGTNSPLKKSFYDVLTAMGDYPNNPLLRKIAISNGNGTGYSQMGNSTRMSPGARIVYYDVTVAHTDAFGVTGVVGSLLFDGGYTKFIYIWGIPVGVIYIWLKNYELPQHSLLYDQAPGGWRDTQQKIADASVPLGDITTEFPNHCFIPTISAFDLRQSLTGPPLDLHTNVSALTPGSYYTPFDAMYFDPGESNEHVTVTPGIAEHLIQQLEYREPAPTNFVCWSYSVSELKFEWDPVTNPIAYKFYYSHKVNGAWVNDSLNTRLSTTPAANGKIQFIFNTANGLPANWSEYRFAATAICKGGETGFSNWYYLRYPINVYGIVSSATSATIKWTDDNEGEQSFAVWWRKSDQSTFNAAPNLIIGAAGGTGSFVSGEATGLETGAMYYFMVKAKYTGFYTNAEKQIHLTLAIPAKPSMSVDLIDYPSGDKPELSIYVTCNFVGGTVTYFDIERKTGLNGQWQSINTCISNSVACYTDEVDFNADYYYRAIAVNGMGKSEYSDEIREQIYFATPQLLEVTASTNFLHTGHFHVEWLDSMGIFFNNGSISSNPFYDAMVFYYKKATDTVWQYYYCPVNGFRRQYDFDATLAPMTTYNFKIARVWEHGRFSTYTPFSPTVDIFVSMVGYTNYNNARRLFRGGNNKLNATFYDDTRIYWASSVNNGLSWLVPGPQSGNNSTIAEKRSNNSVYLVRVKNDNLLLDSLGPTSGFGKVIKTGKKMFNPAIATDTLGNIHCVWAETTLTIQKNEVSGVPNYTVSFTVKIYYAKRAGGWWQPPVVINPIVSGSGTNLNSPMLPPLYIPHPTITTTYSGAQVIPNISWEHQHIKWEGLFVKNWITDTLAVYYSTRLNTGTRISNAGLVANYPCLGVNPSGTLALTYQQNGDIYRSTNNGSAWSTPYNVSNNTGSSQMPTVAYDKGGAMHILWFDNSESGFVQKTSTLPAEIDAKLAIAKLTELPPGEESIVWEDSGDVATDTLNPTIAKAAAVDDLTATTVNATQIFYRRYKDNAWSPVYRLTASTVPSIYPSLPLTDDPAQMGFIWTERNLVKYKRLPDLDPPTVAVTFPNGGEVLYNGRRYDITWSSSDNRGVKSFGLYYTTNYNSALETDGVIWKDLATVTGDKRSFSWRIPYNIASTSCRIRVAAIDSSGNAAKDISDKNFTIKSREIVVVETDKVLAYNNAGKIARSNNGLLHVCYNSIDSVHYMVSANDGQTWSPPLNLGKGSLPTIVTDSKNLPVIGWIRQWDIDSGGGVFFSRQTAVGWSVPETLAYRHGAPWDFVAGYSPPSVTIKNDTVSLVYEYACGGGIPPYIAKKWDLHHLRFPLNNMAGAKDTIIDSYFHRDTPWNLPTSASIATDYKGYDHIAWNLNDKVYYRMRKPDGAYGNIVQLSGSGIAQNPCIGISGVASAVWEEGGDIYQRTGFDQKWDPSVNVSASGANSMMPYVCGSDVLWTEDVLSDYEVYLSTYSTAKMTYDASVNLSCTDYASIYPHETKLQTSAGTKTYRIWAEEIEPSALWGITFMTDTTALEPIYALDAGQAEPSIFTVQRDGYITYGTAAKSENTFTEPYKTVDYDTTVLIYSFDNFDPAKKYKITLSFYHETGQDIKLKPIVNKIPLGEIRVTTGKEEILDKLLPDASYKDGQIILTIEKHKGPIAVCGKILIYENPIGNSNGGAQSEEITGIAPNYINKLYQNCPNPFSRKTSFNYQIKNQGLVTFKVYNALGQLVNTLVNEAKPAGAYRVEWDGRDRGGLKVSSGVYIYRLQAGDFIDTKKMVVIK